MQDRIVIVGAGQAGAQLAQSLRIGGHEGPIVMVGDEPQLPYQRPPLSKKFLAGEVGEDALLLRPAAFYEAQRIEVRRGAKVEAIDTGAHTVTLRDGMTIEYDRLVLATGTRARGLPLPGADLPGVAFLRTITDVEALRRRLGEPTRVAIVGAGYIGLEVAAVARAMGHAVTVLEAQDRVMKRAVASETAAFFERLHRDNGVDLRLDIGVAGFEGKDAVEAVALADGSRLPASIVLVAVGAAPNDKLAAAAGLAVDDGILVDAAGRTSAPHIHAVGDCTRFQSARYRRSVRLESVQNAIDQAKAAAQDLCGQPAAYDPVPWFWSDQYATKLQIAGLSQDHDEVRLVGDPASGSFYVVYLGDGRLVAVDSINHPRSHMRARRAIGEPWREELLAS